ncbi:MAG: hypothetical protein HY236_06995 [Acidobacteria bacterium]|nr:hypothetical protein [Acidobacteriota bacterium]
MKVLLLLLLAGAPPEAYLYWIQPCAKETAEQSGCEAADRELAQWALEAWQEAGEGRFTMAKAAAENKARIRIYWAAGPAGMYGETRPILVEGKPGAEVYVLPNLSQLGPEIEAAGREDRLFRHAVVYLTSLHETGHALGLNHTAAFDDIMYFFGFGGDVLEYFSRYRRKLALRADIRNHPGLSPADQARLIGKYMR